MLRLSDELEYNFLDGWTIEFANWPHGHCDTGHRVISVPSVEYVDIITGGEDANAEWPKWWSTLIHEFAHAIDEAWFGREVTYGTSATGHGPTFYAAMIGLHYYVGLPVDSYHRYESSYQPKYYGQGQNLVGHLVLDRLRSINANPDCYHRTIYAVDYCDDRENCSLHIQKAKGQLDFGLI